MEGLLNASEIPAYPSNSGDIRTDAHFSTHDHFPSSHNADGRVRRIKNAATQLGFVESFSVPRPPKDLKGFEAKICGDSAEPFKEVTVGFTKEGHLVVHREGCHFQYQAGKRASIEGDHSSGIFDQRKGGDLTIAELLNKDPALQLRGKPGATKPDSTDFQTEASRELEFAIVPDPSHPGKERCAPVAERVGVTKIENNKPVVSGFEQLDAASCGDQDFIATTFSNLREKEKSTKFAGDRSDVFQFYEDLHEKCKLRGKQFADTQRQLAALAPKGKAPIASSEERGGSSGRNAGAAGP
ncbi:MAG: hypothetical protein ACXWPM_04290 [Bdellovibrionota bacterium]